jgi:hypothetical protein
VAGSARRTTSTGDRQGPADRLDPERARVLVYVGGHRGERRSSSTPKNTADLVGSAQLVDLVLQGVDTLALIGRQAGPGATIDLGLVEPLAEGLTADALPASDMGDGPMAIPSFGGSERMPFGSPGSRIHPCASGGQRGGDGWRSFSVC